MTRADDGSTSATVSQPGGPEIGVLERARQRFAAPGVGPALPAQRPVPRVEEATRPEAATGRSDDPPPPGTGTDRTSGGGPRQVRLSVVVLIVLVLLVLGVAAVVLSRSPAPPASPPSSAPSLPSRPTMIGQVVRVLDGQTVSVRVADQTFDTAIVGIDAPVRTPGGPPVCGAEAATDLAVRTLTGQMVTLVPDPTIPEFDQQGRRLAYVVLRTQSNYTDQAILAGVARAETDRTLWYRDVFAAEQDTARSQGVGIWGPPCRTAG